MQKKPLKSGKCFIQNNSVEIREGINKRGDRRNVLASKQESSKQREKFPRMKGDISSKIERVCQVPHWINENPNLDTSLRHSHTQDKWLTEKKYRCTTGRHRVSHEQTECKTGMEKKTFKGFWGRGESIFNLQVSVKISVISKGKLKTTKDTEGDKIVIYIPSQMFNMYCKKREEIYIVLLWTNA